MKIFIADGSMMGLRRLMMLLNDLKEFEPTGYSLDVENAIGSIIETKPEAVILDLDMRNNSGIEVLKSIKKVFPHIVFIIVTNSSNAHYRSYCKELGAEFFFDRSWEFTLIPDAIKAIAGKLPKSFPVEKNGVANHAS